MQTPAAMLALQRAAASGRFPSARERIDRLERLRHLLLREADTIVAAVNEDFGHRSEFETRLYDLHSVVEGIDYLSKRVRKWMRPRRRQIAWHFKPATGRVSYQPLGVVGVISPWNYPVALALKPLSIALAAGNRVMLKPSEKTPKTSRVLRTLLTEAFDPDEVAVVLGDESIGRAFAQLPFDHLVFTGGTAVGRRIMAAASDNLTPVTLELGGKSPAVIVPGADHRDAARKIAYGKLANAGQTCIAPDYVLLPRAMTDEFIARFRAAVEGMYPEIRNNTDYSAIANDAHFERLQAMIRDARRNGASVLPVTEDDESTIHPRVLLPVVLTGVTSKMAVMREEIFGPVLPVVPYDDVDEAIDIVNARPRPLALYAFGPRTPARDRLIARTTSGGVAINDTILQYAQDDLPFGGVGPSGMGRYHGREGFETFSNIRPVFRQSRFSLAGAARPPFGRVARALLALLNR